MQATSFEVVRWQRMDSWIQAERIAREEYILRGMKGGFVLGARGGDTGMELNMKRLYGEIFAFLCFASCSRPPLIVGKGLSSFQR